MEHDASYKLLFSHARMVEDLLRGFIHEPWVQELDFATLERVQESFVSEDLREREDDIIWRVRWGPRWLYLYLLLEFQSTVDRYMAVRLLVYIGLFYQSLIRARGLPQAEKLPPVVPIVLYNGRRPWTAPLHLTALLEAVPMEMRRYRPRLSYALLEERLYTETELAPLHNLVAAVVRLENSREPAEVRRVLEALLVWLQTPEDDSLRRALATWLRRVLLPARLPQVAMPEVHDLQEIHTMLAERVVEWTEEWKKQGRREGHREGRQQGQLEEARAMIVEAIRSRFRVVPRDIAAAVRRVDNRDTLHGLLRQLVTGATLATVRELLHLEPKDC